MSTKINEIKNFIKMKPYSILVLFILIIGVLLRVINISNIPNALNVDEASAGYEAYSILHSGIDRNGNFLPAFLVAWRKWIKCTFYLFNNTFYFSFWIKYFFY